MSNQTDAPRNAEDPEEIGRNRFLVQATIVMGGVVGLGLTIPLLGALWPKPELINANKGWSSLKPDEFAALKASLDKPVKLNFIKKDVSDGYLPPTDQDYYVWGIHMTPEEEQAFRAERPDLFDKGAVDFPVGTLGFALFSSLCPHLNCKYDWDSALKAFLCPCHGSQFSRLGAHMKNASGQYIGPSPRGLDPIPFREQSGVAEVEWVKFKANEPDRLIVSYS